MANKKNTRSKAKRAIKMKEAALIESQVKIRFFGVQESCRRTFTYCCPHNVEVEGLSKKMLGTSLQIKNNTLASKQRLIIGSLFGEQQVGFIVKTELKQIGAIESIILILENYNTTAIHLAKGSPLFTVSFLCTDEQCTCSSKIYYETECLTFQQIFAHKDISYAI